MGSTRRIFNTVGKAAGGSIFTTGKGNRNICFHLNSTIHSLSLGTSMDGKGLHQTGNWCALFVFNEFVHIVQQAALGIEDPFLFVVPLISQNQMKKI